MDWLQTLFIIGTVIASAYYIHREVQAHIRGTREKIKREEEAKQFLDEFITLTCGATR